MDDFAPRGEIRRERTAVSGVELSGYWRVERVSGLLPPFLRKQIGRDAGWTKFGPMPLARFRVRGRALDYDFLPLRDELALDDRGQWIGRGLLFNREFCRFLLVPVARRKA